ncbi:MAG: tRNA (adenosine(37)-N6)-dimethylallyltransferase MiaA [Myxococcota bacterium]|nr:tRNA (adenosine(37)-N6)-dimethylallyltransferase MiaA [Myxococcota bacterium]
MKPKIVVLGGVTAAGKTGAAITLAERLGGELIGADSVQIHRELDVGSAKPTPEELRGVTHHLIDRLPPTETIDAARYAALADAAIRDVAARGRLPIVVGGTGLWLRALTRGLAPLPKPDPALRARLEAEAADDLPALHARLTEVDPEAASRIHPNDALRIVRALEVFTQTGEPMSAHHARHARGGPRYEMRFYALDLPREVLYPKLKARIRAMLDAGWVEEVRGVLARHGRVPPLKSVGYAQVVEHVEQGVPIEETERLAYKATRVYTRRQRTWFRGEGEAVRWTNADALVEASALSELEGWVRRGG